jgi:serine protease Do
MGIISSPHRLVPVTVEGYMDWEMDFIQTDAAINQGNSGGALVNLDGQVIGINSMKVSFTGVEGLGFAIPINEAKPVIESLIQFGKVKRVFVGINHQDLQSYSEGTEVLNLPKGVTRGIIVMEAQGPAKKAGLKGKDVIVEMDGMTIDSSLTMRKYLYSKKKIGDDVEIVFYRDGNKMRVTLKLAEKE